MLRVDLEDLRALGTPFALLEEEAVDVARDGFCESRTVVELLHHDVEVVLAKPRDERRLEVDVVLQPFNILVLGLPPDVLEFVFEVGLLTTPNQPGHALTP